MAAASSAAAESEKSGEDFLFKWWEHRPEDLRDLVNACNDHFPLQLCPREEDMEGLTRLYEKVLLPMETMERTEYMEQKSKNRLCRGYVGIAQVAIEDTISWPFWCTRDPNTFVEICNTANPNENTKLIYVSSFKAPFPMELAEHIRNLLKPGKIFPMSDLPFICTSTETLGILMKFVDAKVAYYSENGYHFDLIKTRIKQEQKMQEATARYQVKMKNIDLAHEYTMMVVRTANALKDARKSETMAKKRAPSDEAGQIMDFARQMLAKPKYPKAPFLSREESGQYAKELEGRPSPPPSPPGSAKQDDDVDDNRMRKAFLREYGDAKAGGEDAMKDDGGGEGGAAAMEVEVDEYKLRFRDLHKALKTITEFIDREVSSLAKIV